MVLCRSGMLWGWVIAALAFLWVGVAHAEDTYVKTEDGIYLRFRGFTGEILSLVNLGQAVDLVPREERRPPFSASEYGREGNAWPLPVKLASDGDNRLKLEGGSEAAELSLRGEIEGRPSFIRFDLEITDLRGQDRALTVRFEIPVSAAGWSWWDDVGRARTIQKGKRYVRYDDETRGVYPLCWYPLGCISQAEGPHALVFAVGMDPPALVRTGYDSEFFAEFDVGLSPQTKKFPASAKLTFYLFNSDPSWGLRDALRKYYAIFPQLFAKRVTREGNWVARHPTQFIPGIEDFHPAFHEASSVMANAVPFDNKAGIYAFRYDEPGAARVMGGLPDRATYASALAAFQEMAKSDSEQDRKGAALIEALAIKAPNDRYVLSSNGGGFRGYRARFIINLDPALPPPPGVESPIETWRRTQKARILDLREGRYDGQYIDSAEFFSDPVNCRADHLAHADFPLGWDGRSGRVGMHNSVSTWAYLKQVSRELHDSGKLMMANWTPWRYGFFMPLLDVAGAEVWESPRGWLEILEQRYGDLSDRKKLEDAGLSEEQVGLVAAMLRDRTKIKTTQDPHIAWHREDLMYYRRAMSYQKPYCLLLKLMDANSVKSFGLERYRSYIEWCLFFGVYPSCSEGVWQEEGTEMLRSLYRKYMPVARAVGEAGWEPVTHARTDDLDVRVERFGYSLQHSLHFTVRNFGAQPKTFKISIDTGALVIPDGAEVKDALEGELLAAAFSGTTLEVPMSLDPGRTTVLRVGS